MKQVKCYGRVQVTTVDSSFKKNFFGSLDYSNFAGSNNFQEFQQKGSSSFTSGTSTSDYTNIHSCELFASYVDSCDLSVSASSNCSSRNLRNPKSAKHTVVGKTGQVDPFSYTSTSHSSLDLQPVFTSKAKKPLSSQRHTRASKSCVKKRTSKQFKTSKVAASYSSHTDLKLSYSKGRSKNTKLVKSYKKGVLKRKRSTNRHYNLRKHSSIPLHPSCSEFFENPTSVMNTGMKKPNKKKGGKKKHLINKDYEVAGPNSFIKDITSFNSKHDSFWAAIQPNWSSINEYSFKIENTSMDRKKTIPVSIEPQRNKNTAFPDLIAEDNKLPSSKRILSSEITVQSEVLSSCKHLAVEKCISTAEYNVKKDNFSKQVSNLINSSETVHSKLKTTENIVENVAVCKNPSAISCTDLVDGHILPEIESTEIQHRNDEIASIVLNLCETVSEKLNVNEVVAVNTDKNILKDKGLRTCEEVTKTKKSNKDIIAAQTDFSANLTVSKDKNNYKRKKEDEGLLEIPDQSQEYVFAKPFIKSTDFYSSTPLTSPSTHTTVVKSLSSVRAFSPFLQKGLFTTSTPAHSSKRVSAQQNQVCNVSRISHLRRQCSSLQDLSMDSSVKLRRCPSTKINLSVLPRINKSHASFINGSSNSYQNTHHTSRSCISFSRRGQVALEESRCSKNWSLIHEASRAGTSSGSNFESPLTKLLKFCGQTRIIPFSELYDWSHTTVRKIGEGTYGEVFTLVQRKISSVIKVIPFSEESGDHSMQSIDSVLSEVTVSKCLSELRNNKNYKTRNFNKLKSVHVVRGDYPNQMLVAWDKYSDAKTTYNSRPDVFNDQQIFAIIELEYGGKDMTCFILRNAAEAESVLKQIAISLAIAEEVHLFEHRDLHLGNILVQRNNSKAISYVLGGKSYSIPNHGLVVTIIDFTLSRVLHEGCIFYNDLADDNSLFDQSGDYQYQIYKDTKQLLNNEWHKCLLYSNVLWLTFLCVKLLDSTYSRPSSKKHDEGLKNIRTFQNNLSDCQNAFECLTACNILKSVPKKIPGSAQKMAKKAKLVDRNSLQKSVLRHTSNIA